MKMISSSEEIEQKDQIVGNGRWGNGNRQSVVMNNGGNLRNFACALESPLRKGKLTLASPRSAILRGRPLLGKRGPKKDQETLVSPAAATSKKFEVPNLFETDDTEKDVNCSNSDSNEDINDSNKKTKEVVLVCPSNYDDDISSISDVFINSLSKRKEMRKGRGEEISFIPRRAETTDAIAEETSRDINSPATRASKVISRDFISPGTRSSNVISPGGRSDDDSFSLPPWYKQKTKNEHCNAKPKKRVADGESQHGDDNDDDNTIVLLPPWYKTGKKNKDDEPSESGISIASGTSRGQDDAYVPRARYHCKHKEDSFKF